MPAPSLGTSAHAALARLLTAPSWELLPLRSTPARAALLEPGATLTVTASPGKPIEATTRLAASLQAAGHRAIPHLAARMVRDRAHLVALVDALREAGVSGVFVVGGDAASPGDFPDALALLRELAELDHGFTEIGIGVHPQGHPVIPTQRLDAALRDKAAYATHMTNQVCFDASAMGSWLTRQREAGIALPLHLAVPGVLRVHRLLEISARIGVTDAARFVRGRGGMVARLLRPRGFRPERLLRELAPLCADPEAAVQRLHLYTFNQVGPTLDWLVRFRQRLEREAADR